MGEPQTTSSPGGSASPPRAAPGPAARSPGWAPASGIARATRWGWALGALLLALGLRFDGALPEPLTADAPAEAFSAARAAITVEALAGGIPLRASGTPGAREAAAYLEARLRELPALQIEIQDERARIAVDRWGLAVSGSTRNVLALLPGASEEIVLLSAHYDSPPTSPGAADDAAGVAVLLEVARALHAGPRLPRSVLFLFNGAEEPGLVGSAAFLEHPRRALVRAFVNVEAAGSGGKAALFQVDGGLTALEAYRAVPSPHGMVLAEELFSVLGGSVTDFDAYAPGPAVGVDQALFLDGYAYHTPLDTPGRLARGSLQHLGANTLALTRAFAGAGNLEAAPGRPVYFDVLGVILVAYGATTHWLLGGGLLVAALLVVGALARRVGVRTLLGGLRRQSLRLGAAALLCLVGAAALSVLNPHGWYAAPAWGLVTFGALSLAALLWAPAADTETPELRVAGALCGWVVVTAAMLAVGLRSAYLPLAWCAALTAQLALARLRPRWSHATLPLLLLLPALLWISTGLRLHGFLVPLAGTLPVDVPLDAAVGLLALLIVGAPASCLPLPPRRLRRAPPVLLGLGAVGLGVLLTTAPYTPERPKRMLVVHRTGDEGSQLRLTSLDPLAPGPALPPGSPDGWSAAGGRLHREAAEVPIPPVGVSREPEGTSGWREVTLHFAPPGAPGDAGLPFSGQGVAEVSVPPEALVGWSVVGEPEVVPVPGGQVRLVLGAFHVVRCWRGRSLCGERVHQFRR